MQNLMNKIQTKAMTAVYYAKAGINKAKAVLSNQSGQGALDMTIQVLIGIVLGALILGGLYLILDATVLPTLKTRIIEMFDYQG